MNFRDLKSIVLGTLILTATGGIWLGCSPGSHNSMGDEQEMALNAYEAELADEKAVIEKAGKKSAKKADATAKKKKTVKASVAKTDRKPSSAMEEMLYVVQVGAFKTLDNASKLHEKLVSNGYPVELRTIDHSKNGTLHLVRFPGTENKAEAQVLVEKLQNKEDLRAQVLKLSAEN